MLTINTDVRINFGKSYSRRLRNLNKIPAIIYGKNKKQIHIIINHNLIYNINNKKAIINKKILLVINKIIYKVKVKTLQYHPYKLKIIHIDFIYI